MQKTAKVLDGDGHPNVGGTKIHVFVVPLTSGAFAEVRLPQGIECKGLVARMRDGSAWKVAESSALGTAGNYQTVDGSLPIALSKIAWESLFFAKSAEAAGTLEVLVLY